MTATHSALGTRRRTTQQVRRLALSIGALLAAIGSRWNAFVEAGQLGPDTERSVSRHTGARI